MSSDTRGRLNSLVFNHRYFHIPLSSWLILNVNLIVLPTPKSSFPLLTLLTVIFCRFTRYNQWFSYERCPSKSTLHLTLQRQERTEPMIEDWRDWPRGSLIPPQDSSQLTDGSVLFLTRNMSWTRCWMPSMSGSMNIILNSISLRQILCMVSFTYAKMSVMVRPGWASCDVVIGLRRKCECHLYI